MPPTSWRKTPTPDPDVIEALETALQSARLGYVRAIVIVTVNPIHEVETVAKGLLEGASRHALIGGLSLAAHKLLKNGAG